MRYYLYLDRCFLRNLFSVMGNSDFNIEVVEYSVRKSNTQNNQLSIDPCIENFCQVEDEFQKLKEKDIPVRNRNSNFVKKRAGTNFGTSNSSTVETQRRYINIEDITEIKNNCFYHELIEDIKNKETKDEKRIIEEVGVITLYNNAENYKLIEDEKNGFFLLNDKLIWFYNELLEGSIKILAQMSCEVRVIGYMINCYNSNRKVIKAIAIYIE